MKNKDNSMDTFDKNYSENEDHKNTSADINGRFETYGNDLMRIKAVFKHAPKTVWTCVDSDNGIAYVAGFHFVNRLYYLVTNEEWTNESEFYELDLNSEDQ